LRGAPPPRGGGRGEERRRWNDDEPLAYATLETVQRMGGSSLYERSAVARRRCVKYYGCSCSVCGFSFESVYGELGRDYIHVHHIVPLAELDAEYEVDPIRDLRPVCPNCHAMLHRKSPALSIDDLKKQISPNKSVDHYGSPAADSG